MTLLAVAAVSFVFLAPLCAQAFPGRGDSGSGATPAPGTDSTTVTVTGVGSQPSAKGPADHFTGSVRVDMLFLPEEPSRVSCGLVTFEPGARTAWHSHPLGQRLVVTAGVGWVGQWGGPVQVIRPGDVVRIPPGQKHWHGATATTGMSHYAIQESLDGKTVEWMEKVSDEQYGATPPAQASGSPAPAPSTPGAGPLPTPAQQLMGDLAPKLAELTDDVLYGDVWARPQLSQRDRSLVTVSALIALNRPEQLRSHIARARANGVTREELIEAITHLAFYAGWPSAVTAVTVAREVLATSSDAGEQPSAPRGLE